MGRDRVMDWQVGLDKLNMASTSGANSFADVNVSNGSLGAFIWWDADANGGGASNGFWLVGQNTSVVDASDLIFNCKMVGQRSKRQQMPDRLQ